MSHRISTQDKSPEKRQRTYFEFDGGQFMYQKKSVHLKGKILFEFPHKSLKLDERLVTQLCHEMTDWVHCHFSEEGQRHCLEIMDETVHWLLFCMPKDYLKNDPVNRQKRLSYGKYTIMAWIHDVFDQLKSRPNYPKFLEWSESMIRSVFRGTYLDLDHDHDLDLDHDTDIDIDHKQDDRGLEALLKDVEFSGFADFHPCVRTYFHSCWLVAQDLRQIWGFTEEQVDRFIKAYARQYQHDTWLGRPTESHLANFSLRKTTRYYSVGGIPFLHFCAMLDGIQLTEDEREEKHFRRLKYLLMLQAAHINDLLSVKKEIVDQEPDNLILLYCRHKYPALGFEDAVKRLIRKHDRMHEEAKDIYEYLIEKYPEDSNIAKMIRILVGVTEGVVIFHMQSSRYRCHFDWRVVSL